MRLLVAILCWTLASPVLAINIGNVTISDTLLVPAGETGDLSGTVTFDGGVIEVDGSLSSSLNVGDIDLVGTGRIELSTPSSGWGFRCCYSNIMTIGPGIEILGAPGASYASGDSILRGVMAAVAGETTEPFEVFVYNDFVNEGVLEARSGAILEIKGMTSAPDFNEAGVVRALPGGVVLFDRGNLSSFDILGTLDNQGEMQFRRAVFDIEGGELQVPSGDWTLLDGTQIKSATITATPGGRLLVRDYKPYTGYNTLPSELRDVVLATDLHIRGGAAALAGTTTFDAAAVYLSASGASLHFDSAMATLGGTGSIIADGGTTRLYVMGPLTTIAQGIALESRAGALVLDKLGSGNAAYDIAGSVTAEGGKLTIATPTTTRGAMLIKEGGVLDVKAPLNVLGSLDVEPGGQLHLNAMVANDVPVTMSGGVLSLSGLGDFTNPAQVALENSLVVHSGQRTLANLTQYSGPGVDYGVGGGILDLQEGAIAIGSTPGARWYVYGAVKNGVINSLDGSELVPGPPPGIAGHPGAVLTDIELNANARVSVGATLGITGALTGTGKLIVDGGKLELGAAHLDSTTTVRAALSRIEPHAGEVAMTGTIVNHGETLRFPTGVRWGYSHLRSDGIVGGRIEGEPGAVLFIDGGYGGFGSDFATFKEGVTLALPVAINHTYAFVRGGLTLEQAHVTLGATTTPGFNPSVLVFFNEQTLEGTGDVRFGPTPSSAPHVIEIPSDAGSLAGLTVGAGITVRTSEGNGIIRQGVGRDDILYATLTNHGLLLAENGHRLELYTEDFAQHGTLRSEIESLLVVHDEDVVNHGRLELAGGQMKFTGDLTQASGSVLAVELSSELLTGGVAPLAVENNVILGGGLEITLADGFAVTLGDRFPLLSAANLLGRFVSVVGPTLDEGHYWRPEIVGGELWLSVDSDRLAGDYNFDGVVDAADYVVWRNDLTLTGPGLVADGDGDMEVGAGDYEVWRANYGRGAATLVAAEGVRVPEPAGWVVVLSLLAATRVSRRVGATR